MIVDCGDESPDTTTSQVLDALLAWQPPRRLTVVLSSTSYDVVIGDDLLARAGALLAPRLPQKRAVIVTDETVAALHLPALQRGLAETGVRRSRSSCRPARRPRACRPTCRRAGPDAGGAGRAPHRGDRPGRRRGRRPRRLRRRDRAARPAVRADADHAAGPGRSLGRRQDRGEHAARQEPGRRILPAAHGAGRHRDARHAAAARTARRLCRDRQGRD